ncbi:MAG: MerR family transcriptional regulator [Isosphaeraceae bacterium]|nr:MerR family transcriptional regulator [Isosphaeraceae bacterium]
MTRSSPEPGAEYSIAAVSKLTGISCHALRVWERRYGFPVPRRSASGHRRFGRDQVEALRLLAARAKQGESIGDLIAAHLAGRPPAADTPSQGTRAAPEVDSTQAGFLAALFACDVIAAEAAFERLMQELPRMVLVTQVVEPALVETGERWFRRDCDIFLAHFVSGFLYRKLAYLSGSARPALEGPTRTIAIGTVRGDRHEGGVLLLELALQDAGWRVVNLGVDLPTEEYDKAVRYLRPDALGLSFVLSRNINKRFHELSQIGDLPVFVGGRSILNYQGLARRHGLIPLPGPVMYAVAQLELEYAAWRARRARRGT